MSAVSRYESQSNSFLSTSVRTLLHSASFTVVPSDQSSEYLTDVTFNWENISLIFKDSSEPQEWALRSKKWFLETIRALVPVFNTAERLCQNAATSDASTLSCLYELWEWTGSAEELSKCLKDLFGPSPNETSAVESMLIISAILERALGNVLRQKDQPVPFLLRDLLLEKPLYDTFGEVPVQFTRLLVGMPSALNARNLVWHGFVAPDEMTMRIPATLLILLASLGKKLQGILFYKNNLNIIGTNELPDLTTAGDIDEWRSAITNPTVIPPQFLPYWEDAFKRYKEQQFGRCLILLLPQLELVLRIGFCVSNDCPKQLLTAVQSAPQTTLDDMLVETTGGRPNNLCKKLGEGLLNALFDLLQRPSGPRIRDRLGHGECSLNDISHNLAAVLLSLSIAIVTRLSTDEFGGALFWDSYTARFHPTTLLLKTSYEVLHRTEELLEVTSATVPIAEENFNNVSILEKALTDGDPKEAARLGLEATASSLATLFRPRQEIIATVAMLRGLRCLCVALEATRLELGRRLSDEAEGRLRSRQRKTLQRMVQIIPLVTRMAICLVIMAMRIMNTVANNLDEFARWQRCISQMEKFTEKLSSYVHGTKNRWEEVKLLTFSFCDTVLPFFVRYRLPS